MSKLAFIPVLAAAVFLSGCLDPVDYETQPVKVKTAQGVVVCQLYTHDKVLWDRAISAPKGMPIETADEVCIREGHRVKAAL